MMKNDLMELMKVLLGLSIAIVLVAATLYSCWGGYLDDPKTKINENKSGIAITVFADTTASCWGGSSYYTVVVVDPAKDSVNWFSPCYRCGRKYGAHHSADWWYWWEATSRYQD